MTLKSEGPNTPCDKWELFRTLCTAKDAYGLKDRDLMVLNALLSFLPVTDLSKADGLIVFPSNKTLCARAHGMAESTLRRHIAKLCDAGLITRHDSPNGKRYARRGAGGTLVRAFGFDLAPMVRMRSEIAANASEATHLQERIKELKEAIVLRLRDIAKIGAERMSPDDAHSLEEARKMLRRKAAEQTLNRTLETVESMLTTLLKAQETSANDSQIERHHYNSNTNSIKEEKQNPAHISPRELIETCSDIAPYFHEPPRHWQDVISTADRVRPMLGITEKIWRAAQRVLGSGDASVVLACMVQMFDRIQNPNGYLRHLTLKAERGSFSLTPILEMVRKRRGVVPS